MKSYRVTVGVTTTYTVEVHAEDEQAAGDISWCLELNEIEAQGSANVTEVTAVRDVEEIQREGGEDGTCARSS